MRKLQQPRRTGPERNKLVEANLRLVYHVTGRMLRMPPGAARDDCEQVGMLALMRSADLWDETSGIKFSTYAVRSIVLRIDRHLRTDRLVAVPDVRTERYDAYRRQARCTSLERLSLTCLHDDDFHPSAPTPHCPHAHDDLHAAIASLPPRLRRLLHATYWRGLGGAEIGRLLGISRARVNQMVRTAKDRVRRELERATRTPASEAPVVRSVKREVRA